MFLNHMFDNGLVRRILKETSDSIRKQPDYKNGQNMLNKTYR